MNHGESKLCPACAAQFVCHNSGQQACWCASLPKIMPLPSVDQAAASDAVAGCYCPACLQRIINEKTQEKMQETALPTSN